MSTITRGRDKRKASKGIRLWPPARTFASGPCSSPLRGDRACWPISPWRSSCPPKKPRAPFAPWDRREIPGIFTVEESADAPLLDLSHLGTRVLAWFGPALEGGMRTLVNAILGAFGTSPETQAAGDVLMPALLFVLIVAAAVGVILLSVSLLDVVARLMLVLIWIRNGGRRIARGKRRLDRAVESGLAVSGFLVEGVLSLDSVHSVTLFPRAAPTMNAGRAQRVEH